jgi:hypothetical protein
MRTVEDIVLYFNSSLTRGIALVELWGTQNLVLIYLQLGTDISAR